MLYKFRSPEKLEFTLDIILNQRLYCADWNDLNDPMEGIFEYRTLGDQKRLDQLSMIRERKLRYRVCSLSKSWRNPLLWAHYADGFKGVAVELDLDSVSLSDGGDVRLHPSEVLDIEYRSTFQFADTERHQDAFTLAQRILSSKHECWSYEDEARVLSESCRYDVTGKIRRVILGTRTSDTVKDAIKKAAVGKRIEVVQLVIGRERLDIRPIRRGAAR